MQVYLVGGAVRDAILGLPIRERDWVVVGATPECMLTRGFKQVGRDFPVFLHPKTREEYALARKERKTGAGYYGFACEFDDKVTLLEDLSRRDLTINAMAQDEQGQLIDPFGGQADIKARLLRHVSNAFVEDAVRVLRLARFKARFHALGFQLAEETSALVYQMVQQGELAQLVPERVWQEWEKSFSSENPEQFIAMLRQTGALSVLFPEIDALFGVPQKKDYHPEMDAGVHTLEVVARLQALQNNNLTAVFAALTHDLGKACTPKSLWPAHPDHDQLGEAPLLRLCERLRVPLAYKKLARLVMREHLNIHRAWELADHVILNALVSAQVFQQGSHLETLLLIVEADATARFPMQVYRQRDFWRTCAEACLAIHAKPWVDAGLAGSAIQTALKEARFRVIQQVKRQFDEEKE